MKISGGRCKYNPIERQPITTGGENPVSSKLAEEIQTEKLDIYISHEL